MVVVKYCKIWVSCSQLCCLGKLFVRRSKLEKNSIRFSLLQVLVWAVAWIEESEVEVGWNYRIYIKKRGTSFLIVFWSGFWLFDSDSCFQNSEDNWVCWWIVNSEEWTVISISAHTFLYLISETNIGKYEQQTFNFLFHLEGNNQRRGSYR